MKHYDIIFTGGGLAALLTLSELVKNNSYASSRILVIDSETKNTNDRTWCFWDTIETYDSIASKNWKHIWFKTEQQQQLPIAPYQYKMIRSKAFYEQLLKEIESQNTIEFFKDSIINFYEEKEKCIVETATATFSSAKIINSVYEPKQVISQTKYPLVQQHFVGWFVKTKEPVFTQDCPTFMDFSVEQKGNTRFMYILPTSPTEALLEYTLFSKDVLPKTEYEEAIQQYLKELGVTNFEILEKEQGNIPMTCYPFWKHNSKNIIHIGSAGGWTKASTGYTFKNSLKKSKELVAFLQTGMDFTKFHKINKFWFYDLLLIDILFDTNQHGKSIFNALFKHKNAPLIFKFLDEETSIWEDLQIIWMCPKSLFLRALLKRIRNGF